jgi:HSP20 family molecular chaperone IbpA
MYTILNGFKPVQQARKLNESIDNLLRDPFWTEFDTLFTKSTKGWCSSKNENDWVLEMAVPGFAKEDLKIKMVKTELSIVSTNEDNKWLGSFEKLFTVPSEVNVKKVKAKVENGVLTITLPIKEESESFIDIK